MLIPADGHFRPMPPLALPENGPSRAAARKARREVRDFVNGRLPYLMATLGASRLTRPCPWAHPQ